MTSPRFSVLAIDNDVEGAPTDLDSHDWALCWLDNETASEAGDWGIEEWPADSSVRLVLADHDADPPTRETPESTPWLVAAVEGMPVETLIRYAWGAGARYTARFGYDA